tara:strand:- start:220 stop:510 length:291 start_codon:yes stop_codon:yes gene_type:complete
MTKIAPDCLRTKAAKQVMFTSRGYFLPCCECDTRNSRKEFQLLGFFQEKFHVDNLESVEQVKAVINSDEWQDFYKDLLESPENSPEICKEFCKAKS